MKEITHAYFIGIGGAGMSALARYFHASGKVVFGYDRNETNLTRQLGEEGITVIYEKATSAIPPAVLACEKATLCVVYTPAVPDDHPHLSFFLEQGYRVNKRSEVVGKVASDKKTIAVAGTHGKTTISSMLAHILNCANWNACAILGGIAVNYASNFIGSHDADYLVVEADEYDRSFLTLHPEMAVVSSIDADHMEVYQTDEKLKASFQTFVENIKQNGHLSFRKGVQLIKPESIAVASYSIEEEADFYATNIRSAQGQHLFDVNLKGKWWKDIGLGIAGLHNVENATAAIGVSNLLGIEEQTVKAALFSFQGVQRRFEYQIRTEQLVFIDDYAHHPVEVEACIRSVKEMYPNKKVFGIFQPHLFSRTQSFASEFAKSLSLLDELVLLPIYPAREQPIEGVSAQLIFDQVTIADKHLMGRNEVLAFIPKQPLEILLTMGAGDIGDLVNPIKMALEKQTSELQ